MTDLSTLREKAESYHSIQLVIEDGELHRRFVCTAPGDASCRRRPEDFEDGRESWTAEEATRAGFPCWAVDWVEAVGIEDALYMDGESGTVLASVPVSIAYDEGVEVTPILDPNRAEKAEAKIARALEIVRESDQGDSFLPVLTALEEEPGSDGLTDLWRTEVADNYIERTTPTEKARKAASEWLAGKSKEED